MYDRSKIQHSLVVRGADSARKYIMGGGDPNFRLDGVSLFGLGFNNAIRREYKGIGMSNRVGVAKY